jgi:hypothetical protein
MCRGVEIAYAGTCSYDFAICDVCGFGSQPPVVDECLDDGFEITQGVCDKTGGDGIPTVNDAEARGWLAIQQAGCQGTVCFDPAAVAKKPCPSHQPLYDTSCWPDGGAAGTGGSGSGGSGGSGGTGGNTPAPDAGAAAATSGGAASRDADAMAGAPPLDVQRQPVASEKANPGCGCRVQGTRRVEPPLTLAWLALVWLVRRARRVRARFP